MLINNHLGSNLRLEQERISYAYLEQYLLAQLDFADV
jgi:hypothetical protein